MNDERIIRRLQNINCNNIKQFSFLGVESFARVAKVIDADTIAIVFYVNGQLTKLNVRLNGIDAPELKSKNVDESQGAKEGAQALATLIDDKIVRVVLSKFDKYGRVLADLFTLEPIVDDIKSVNDWLIRFRYAREYNGGKKVTWSKEELDAVGTKKED